MNEVSTAATHPPLGRRPEEPATSRRYAWGVFAMAFALMVFDYLDRQLIVSMFPHLKQEWGLSDKQLGGLVSVVSVTVALGTFPVALLVDRWSRVKSIALMGGIWSMATIAAAFTRNYGQLFAARAAVGLGEAGYAPAAAALLSRMFPQRLRATVLRRVPVRRVAGCGAGCGARRSDRGHVGMACRVRHRRHPGPGLLALLFLLVRDYRTVPLVSRWREAPRLGLRSLLAELLRPRSAVAAYLGGATQIVVMSALYAWLPSYFNRYLGLPPTRPRPGPRWSSWPASSARSCCRSPPTGSPAVTAATGCWCRRRCHW